MLYSIGEFATKVGRTIQTIRNWDRTDILKPVHIAPSGHRYYSQSQVDKLLGLVPIKPQKLMIGYCRVSSNKQKDDLIRQVDFVQQFMVAHGYSFEIISDVGSGINYTNPGLRSLIEKVKSGLVDKVVILHKDCLLRFGFELVEYFCSLYHVPIDIIDNTKKSEQEELVEDLVQIITVFGAKLNGRRANRTKQLAKELVSNDFSQED
jgi:putative resolvase